MPFLRLFVVSA